MSLLLGEPEHSEEVSQLAIAKVDKFLPNSAVPPINGISPQPVGKDVVEKVSGCLDKVFHSPKESESKGNRRMEWEEAQVLLTQMGIQLIHDTKKYKEEGTTKMENRKKGYRELKNLRFNVNYEGSSCSRGFLTSL